jgi:hypothetical protein
MKEKLEEKEKIQKAEISSVSAARVTFPTPLPTPTPKINIRMKSNMLRVSKNRNENSLREEGQRRKK